MIPCVFYLICSLILYVSIILKCLKHHAIVISYILSFFWFLVDVCDIAFAKYSQHATNVAFVLLFLGRNLRDWDDEHIVWLTNLEIAHHWIGEHNIFVSSDIILVITGVGIVTI